MTDLRILNTATLNKYKGEYANFPLTDTRIGKLLEHSDAQSERIAFLARDVVKTNDEICQILGKALGYPWLKDDPKNFPDATEEHGVCVGDHVAESLAVEAAERICTQIKKETFMTNPKLLSAQSKEIKEE